MEADSVSINDANFCQDHLKEVVCTAPIFTFESIALAKSTYSAKIARPTFAKKMTASMGYATHINNIFFFSSDDIPTTTFFNHIQFDTVDRGAIICPAAFQDGDGVYKCQKHGSYSMYDPC